DTSGAFRPGRHLLTRTICSPLACIGCLFLFFFFSSRRRHTRLVSDWSSDVCSSDLLPAPSPERVGRVAIIPACKLGSREIENCRSEERRVGKECRSRWAADN